MPAWLACLAAACAPILVVSGHADGRVGTTPARLVTTDPSGRRPRTEEPRRFRSVVDRFLDAAE
ncbi:hypothetical protein GCM10023205_59340 [Yinghuangia aomiensis]|uniref:Uncharacterized protein n=1 Tax=Yinghuangia aomiensis TaxID=676205 RepID=A0ABP9HZ97_9ACTN